MKGNITQIWRVYDGQNKRLVIPVYQRNYDWSPKECDRLFDDLEVIIREERETHFFGALVGAFEDSFTYVVIDGQQRLTTVSILLLALAHALRDGDVTSSNPALEKDLVSSFLRVGYGQEARIKLKPVKSDNAAYERLFGPEKHFIDSSNVTANYRLFRERIRATDLTADQVWQAVQRLQVMSLDLEKSDDPQRIFETLNSTGLALTQSDLIRNYVLMGLTTAEQDRLYETFWNPMERNVEYRTSWFARWFLVTVTGRTPNESEVYTAFKQFVQHRRGSTVHDILQEMHDYSLLARQLNHDGTGSKEVDRALARFRTFRADVLLPFLLPVLRDFQRGEITGGDLVRVIEVLESYLLRRQLTGYYANALNKIFAVAYKELRHLRTADQEYADLLIYILRKRDGTSGQFPDDEEFRDALLSRNIYRARSETRAYLFDRLENGRSADVRDVAGKIKSGDLTIEHILPQTLTTAWRAELGEEAEEIHAQWVHRLGNLTITGYNSSYSNLPFAQKKTAEHGFDSSPYRINAYVKSQTRWGAEQIAERTRALAEQALELWPLPPTSFSPPAPVLPMETMGEDTSFTGRALVAFEFEGSTTTVNSWKEMTLLVLQAVAREHRTQLLEVLPQHRDLIDLSQRSGDRLPKGVMKVDAGIGAFLSTSTDAKLDLLRRVFDHAGIDPEELTFTLRPRSAQNEDSEDEQVNGEEDLPAAPWSPLLKFRPRFEELNGANADLADTAELRAEFRRDAAPCLPADPAAVLSGRHLTVFDDPRVLAGASADEVLAVMALTLRMEQDFDPGAFHQRITSGGAALWLDRLARISAG